MTICQQQSERRIEKLTQILFNVCLSGQTKRR